MAENHFIRQFAVCYYYQYYHIHDVNNKMVSIKNECCSSILGLHNLRDGLSDQSKPTGAYKPAEPEYSVLVLT
ncbi:conserved hypothetical protein [Ricinus communis]|uniref:Uncharacterized protein n=1 Tax=Ricinus communis TaxID=3988 RepID=B9SBH1_RICCO|nr:conserved hypothetical protein [Ricinus communis]